MKQNRADARIRQQGAALLTLMLLIFLATTAFYLRQSNGSGAHRQIDAVTTRAMAQAKEALLGRAATDTNRPGSLTCPDTNNDGVADGDFGNCSNYVGRLPWKTLDIPEPLDGNGERLWYALSPGIRDSDAAQPINSSKGLALTLDGVANIAAIVFSPGAPLAGQTGRPSSSIADYLDGSNSDGDANYVSGLPSAQFNDQILAITRDDIFRVANRRVLGEIRGPDNNPPAAPLYGLRHYHSINGSFPWADTDGDGNGDVGKTTGSLPYKEIFTGTGTSPYTWLSANKWFDLITYTRVGSDSVRISIASSQMDVVPCPVSPCQ